MEEFGLYLYRLVFFFSLFSEKCPLLGKYITYRRVKMYIIVKLLLFNNFLFKNALAFVWPDLIT